MNEQWVSFANEIKKMYGKYFVPLHEPTFNDTEIEYVTDCVKSGWVSSVGKYVDRFERELAEFTGVKRAVAVVNGTAALQIAMKIAGVKPNDEVFMPALTFIATANAASYLQAIPHFVDVSEETLGLDPMKLEEYIKEIGVMKNGNLVNKKTDRIIRAVVPMHTFGHPVDLDPLVELCLRYNLALVEDAAESLGSYYKGKHTGGFGVAAALSFNGNKIMTTGGGGAILTNDERLADYAKHITTTAKVPHQWEYVHDEIGYNYRMPNLNAALGCAQLTKIEGFLASKRALAIRYEKLVEQIDGTRLFMEPTFATSNYWLQTVILDSEVHRRDDVLALLNDAGAMARPIWTPLNELSEYKICPKDELTVTEKLKETIINIPSNPLKGHAFYDKT
ncbi:LegC family aminotransferase [Sporosarcina sp. GW1-11]|uniref:LegC family aminotransferase n=1 Tax=Sporosarcina sp. GW1-11 TaxID=2899126 RepID=UPI00294D489A|nr:LegC family aminotransferase [Sporosarcina sp. GW1-11]MDV6376985.1 LegC family aminotransferase [Sporosarcina sp. GW1-11]